MLNLKKLFATTLLISLILPATAFAAQETKPTDIYCKTTVYHAEQLKDSAVFNNEPLLQNIEYVKNSTDELNLVKTVQKEYYVSETYSLDGKVLDSHLMTNEEVANLDNEIQPCTVLGDEEQTKGKLTFTASLYDDDSNNYYIYATADWENGSWVITDGEEFPAAGKDYIGISWGGGDFFKKTDSNFSGTYQVDGSSISYLTPVNNSYQGICWSFNERKDAGNYRYFADIVYTRAKISPVPVNIGDQSGTATALVKYIHTYDDNNVNITFAPSSNGSTVGIDYSGTTNAWAIETDFRELQY